MKQEIQNQLAIKATEILTQVQEAVKTGAHFTMEQLPDIAQQYVAFGRVMSVVAMFFFVVAAVIMYTGITFTLKEANKSDTEAREGLMFVAVFVVIVAAIYALVYTSCSCGLKSDIMVWVAPKVWLIKELAEMVK